MPTPRLSKRGTHVQAELQDVLSTVLNKPDYRENYILEHSYRVAEMALTEPEFLVGLAHDIVEDHHLTFEQVKAFGMTDYEMEALELVTRKQGEIYREFIKRIAEGNCPLAIHVKIYDLLDHLHPINHHWLRATLTERYVNALEVLTAVGVNNLRKER